MGEIKRKDDRIEIEMIRHLQHGADFDLPYTNEEK